MSRKATEFDLTATEVLLCRDWRRRNRIPDAAPGMVLFAEQRAVAGASCPRTASPSQRAASHAGPESPPSGREDECEAAVLGRGGQTWQVYGLEGACVDRHPMPTRSAKLP